MSVLGSGLAFPYAVQRGQLETASGTDSVEAAIAMVFQTPRGSRFMLPGYGSDLHRLLFQPADEETLALAIVYAREAIQEWVPRVDLLTVRGRIEQDPPTLWLQVHYRYASHPTPQMMVYPYYLLPTT